MTSSPCSVRAVKAIYYHHLLDANDTFDGVLPEVSSFWEAASEVLLPLRADPVKVGPVHSFVRDESRAEPRHILTRRQIVRDSGGATFKTKVEGGDVIVEFDRDGDPRRPDEVRFSYGAATRTPKRYRVNGIRDGLHALKHATWLAAVAVFRGAERRITTEWDGPPRLPGRSRPLRPVVLQGQADLRRRLGRWQRADARRHRQRVGRVGLRLRPAPGRARMGYPAHARRRPARAGASPG
jgi:hypothetical protein